MPTSVEDTASRSKLISPIPRADQILHARVETRFYQPYQEPDSVKLLSSIASRCTEGEYSPEDFQDRYL
jgi:hypothetical protein